MNRASIFGLPLDLFSLDQTVEMVGNIIEKNEGPVQHCVLNAHKINLTRKDRRLRGILQNCRFVQADGMSIVWAARLFGLGSVPRVTGIDLMEGLLKEASRRRYRLFFLGAKEETLKSLLSNVSRDFPGIVIAGSHHGFFKVEEGAEIVKEISSSRADILLVALPSPQKEYWLAENLSRLNVPFSMGVGGSFDVYAGKIKRAPSWVQKIGLEWFYRMFQEPVRLGPRYVAQNFIFGGLVFQEFFYHLFRRKG